MHYIVSAYGAGNLGDNAIFTGVRKEFSNSIQIYANVPSHQPNIWYADVIENGFPELNEDCELIIGGGGIFYSEQATKDLFTLVKRALERNMKISIRKVGTEYLSYTWVPWAKKVCDAAYFVSTRSRKSAEILKSIGVKDVIVERDYAYNLTKEDANVEDIEFPTFNNSRPIIGIITGGNLSGLEKVVQIIKFLLTDYGIGDTMCNVVHIPHTRHYVSPQGNDVVTGEMLWSMIDIYHDARYERFKLLPFPETDLKLLNAYTKVHGILGMRYHSFVFSEIIEKPLLGFTSGLKAKTYFEETNRKKYELGDEKSRVGYCDSIGVEESLDVILRAVMYFVAYVKGNFRVENELTEKFFEEIRLGGRL